MSQCLRFVRFVRTPIDTPCGLKPAGCSGDVGGTPRRSRLKGRSGPRRRCRRSGWRGELEGPRIHTSGTTSTVRSCFSPRERLTVKPPNTLQLARCRVPTSRVSHQQAHPAPGTRLRAHATAPHRLGCIPCRLRRAQARFCQRHLFTIKPVRGLVGAQLSLEAFVLCCEKEAHARWLRYLSTDHHLRQAS